MDWQISLGGNIVQSHLYHWANSVFIDFVHTERLDAVFFQNALLSDFDVSQSDIDKTLCLQDGLYPRKLRNLTANAKQEGKGHAVEVSYWLAFDTLCSSNEKGGYTYQIPYLPGYLCRRGHRSR